MASVFDRILRLFARKPSAPTLERDWGKRPDLGPGLRGRLMPDREVVPAEVEDFVYGEQPLFVSSSNVVMAQYFPTDRKMLVEFGKQGGKSSAYLYADVSVQEAVTFAQAPSKGKWVWDVLRVRGTKNGHRKPYQRVR